MIIGILLNKNLFKQMINLEDTFENLSFYQHFSYQRQVAICFYSMQGLSQDPMLEGFVIDPFTDSTALMKVPWPVYHYCRAVLNKAGRKKIEKIISANRLRFFQLQSGEERNKLRHLALLRLNPELADHLPDSLPFTIKYLLLLLRKYEQVVIKPITGSLGKNIVLIEKRGGSYFVKSKELSSDGSKKFTHDGFLRFIKLIKRQQVKYLVQERVKSDTYLGRIYECRISVQKNETGQWQVTGKAIRLAQPGEFLTNIHQGADALPFKTIFSEDMPVVQELNHFSIMIAEELAKHFKVIDLGLDLILDRNHRIWFIESNLRDQRLTYKAVADYETWYRTTVTPLSFILSEIGKEPQHNSIRKIVWRWPLFFKLIR